MTGPRLLDSYLKQHNLTLRQFAKKAKVPASSLCRVTVRGKRLGYESLMRIHDATDGAVPFTSWRDKPKKKRKAALVA